MPIYKSHISPLLKYFESDEFKGCRKFMEAVRHKWAFHFDDAAIREGLKSAGGDEEIFLEADYVAGAVPSRASSHFKLADYVALHCIVGNVKDYESLAKTFKEYQESILKISDDLTKAIEALFEVLQKTWHLKPVVV